MRVDHLNSLRALDAVLRKGGLRPAAEELGVTPAAVGQQIRTLETYLGIPLLDRHPTGSVPTARAQEIAPALSRHMAGLGDVLTRLRAPQDSNRISLSVLPSFAEYWFPRHLSTLFARIPGIDLRLDASPKLADLFSGEYDFAVRYMDAPSPEFESRMLLEDYCAPVCTPDFARRYALSPDTTSLEHVPIAEIDVGALGSSSDIPDLYAWCETFSVTPPDPSAGLVMLDYSSGYRMATSGLAIYLEGIHNALGELESGAVVVPLGPDRFIRNPHKFWLIWRKDLRLSPAQKQFVTWITEHADKDRDRIGTYIKL